MDTTTSETSPTSSRPQPQWMGTSKTIVEVKDTVNEQKNLKDAEAGANGAESKEKEQPHKLGYNTWHLILISAILFMLAWPWIFLGVVWHTDGIVMNAHVARVVRDHPASVTFFVTQFGTISSLIVAFLFSTAIIRLAQKWVVESTEVTVFHVSVIAAFKNQKFPWSPGVVFALLAEHKWLPVLLVAACFITFTFVSSGTTSLITPIPFNKTSPLTGTELDFATTDQECVSWFNSHIIPEKCDWKPFKDILYTTCLGENQLVDVLEAGRGRIVSLLSNNSESQTFSQLGSKDGLRFLGPLRGVLPLGPNGVPAFDTLSPSPLQSVDGMLSYNYTLNLQGLISDVQCQYDTESPITFGAVEGADNWLYQYNGTCGQGQDILTPAPLFTPVNANNSLGWWACNDTTSDKESYLVYLRGRDYYNQTVGDITCTVSPIQPAVFPVTYLSQQSLFVSGANVSTSSRSQTELSQRVIKALGQVIYESQEWEGNLVVESVVTFGVKAFGLQPYVHDEQYLQLFEAIIQGIFEYEASYIRMLYSTIPNPPASCIRTVSGLVQYEVTGWHVNIDNVGYLIPMTLINLTSLVLLIVAMLKGEKQLYHFDPTDPRSLVLASGQHEVANAVAGGGGEPKDWNIKVTFNQDAKTYSSRGQLKEMVHTVFDGVVDGGVDVVVGAAVDGVADAAKEKLGV